MGLDITHDCWHGGYISFHVWRTGIARAFGIPYDLMEGLYRGSVETFFYVNPRTELEKSAWLEFTSMLPLKWDMLKPDPVHILLTHSDCNGEISWEDAGAIVDSLEKIIPLLPDGEGGGHVGNWKITTQKFVDGLRKANKAKENVEFC